MKQSRSHCDGRSLSVAARGVRGVGIDLERRRPIPTPQLRYFLTLRERRALRARRVDPLVCWVIKEAAWKALHLDDATHFTALELEWNDGLPVAALLHGRRIRIDAMLFEPWPGYVGAIVALPEAA